MFDCYVGKPGYESFFRTRKLDWHNSGDCGSGPISVLGQQRKRHFRFAVAFRTACRVRTRSAPGANQFPTSGLPGENAVEERMAAPLRLDTYMRIVLKLFNQQSHLSR
jgi:hypothetical protein